MVTPPSTLITENDLLPYDYIYHNGNDNVPRIASLPSHANLSETDEGIDRRQLFKTIKRRWLTIAGVGVMVLGAVAG